MIHEISNGTLTAKITEDGAQLCSLYSEAKNEQLIWKKNPDIWPNTAPILFPFVGRQRDGYFSHKGEKYELGKHGFANRKMFSCSDKDDGSCTMVLTEDEETLGIYPFHFRLSVNFSLSGEKLAVRYTVDNTDEDTIHFFLGSHPGFTLPEDSFGQGACNILIPGVKSLDYYQIKDEMLTASPRTKALQDSKLLLTADTFAEDALVIKEPKFTEVLLSRGEGHEKVRVNFDGATAIGFWAKPGAHYVCIEPWRGVDDHPAAPHELSEKEHIISLPANETFAMGYEVTVEECDPVVGQV